MGKSFACRGPITVTDKLGYQQKVRCGQCINCRIRRASIWTGRATAEWLSAGQRGYFLTLTYDDEHFDGRGYQDVQACLKRLRHVQRLRFYVSPDIGGLNGRFHWHMLLYPVGEDEGITCITNVAQEVWECGFAYTLPIIPQRIRYTCGYTVKKLKAQTEYGRANMSLSFGKAFFLDKGRKIAATHGTLEHRPSLLRIGPSRCVIDQRCVEWLLDGYEAAGGVLKPGLRSRKPSDYRTEAIHATLHRDRLGGMTADIASERAEMAKVR